MRLHVINMISFATANSYSTFAALFLQHGTEYAVQIKLLRGNAPYHLKQRRWVCLVFIWNRVHCFQISMRELETLDPISLSLLHVEFPLQPWLVKFLTLAIFCKITHNFSSKASVSVGVPELKIRKIFKFMNFDMLKSKMCLCLYEKRLL